MPAFTTINLDTIAPAGVSVDVNSGATTVTSRDVSLAIATTDAGGSPTGYQMKIYGDVDDAFDTANYRALEANAPWISFNAAKSVRLSSGDGSKTVKVKIRDDVWNVSTEATDTVTLDTLAPIPDITVVSAAKISKVVGKDETEITWEADIEIAEYKVKVVPATGSTHTQGTQVPTTAGSLNVAATGTVAAETPVTTTIKGADLETAGAEGDNIVKVFARTAAGNWSV